MVNALLALMCFHASRFKARQTGEEVAVLYHEQDETLWDADLMIKGIYYLHQSSQGDQLSTYHLGAAIAYWHTRKADTAEKWQHILSLFDQLLLMDTNPIAAVNRLYALAKVKGAKVAIDEGKLLNLTANQYYNFLMGQLYKEVDNNKSNEFFQQALSLAKTNKDKLTIMQAMRKL